MLFDRNIIIMRASAAHREIDRLVDLRVPAVSIISRVEVLGYHKITPGEIRDMVRFFRGAKVLPLMGRIVDGAINLRQRKNMSLGDDIIAATALEHGMTLVTRNTKDFRWISRLRLLNPFMP